MTPGSTLLKEIGRRIRRRRRELDLTQKELGRLVACSVGGIRQIERGQLRLSVLFLHLLGMALYMSPRCLIDNLDKPEEWECK